MIGSITKIRAVFEVISVVKVTRIAIEIKTNIAGRLVKARR